MSLSLADYDSVTIVSADLAARQCGRGGARVTLNGQRYFPLGDRVSGTRHRDGRDLYAIPSGEFRPPRAGEWYLSGAIPAAYRAPADLSQAFNIARLAETIATRHARRYLHDDGSPID